MKNDIYLLGEIGREVTLQSVINMINESDNTQPLNVHIHSSGGSVYEGLAIYNLLKGLNQEVNTISSGLVASIASIIFLAGNRLTRKINRIDNFLIHLPKGGVQGNAEDFENTAKELRRIEDKLADIYVNETSLTKEQAMDLMKKDEMINVDFLKENGFVNEITEFKAVANLINIKPNEMNEQLTKKEAEGLFSKFEKTLKALFNKEVTNKLVQDATGMEIDFVDVAEDGNPALEDKAMIDGKPAEGSYVMPNGETYVFASGVLAEIIDAPTEEEEAEAPDTSLEDAEARIKELETELANSTINAEALLTENVGLIDKVKEITNEFTELKNSITSNFKPEVIAKPEEKEINQSRTFRKK